MAGLDLLRAIAKLAEGQPAPEKPLEPNVLRFVLEYRAPPDLAAERAKLARLLQTDRFILTHLFAKPLPEMAVFLVLTFPGVERTLSNAELFAISYALLEALDLVSAEPDIDLPIYADPEAPGTQPGVEGVDILGPLCWVDTNQPPPFLWALDNIRAREAWVSSKGAGIIVAQPDTGVAAHHEIEDGALRLDLARNILDGTADPTDPLKPDTANPGHGTATASVVIGREAGHIAGAAPAATLVPIRCIEDVKIFEGAAVAAAIDHARLIGAHVITMSLGGVPSRAVHKAIEKAIDAQMIVLAAAGNCVRIVVWPARYDLVIAVAGTNVADRPWQGSSRGEAVDISAPAELVWRAQRKVQGDPLDVVTPGQGTSFAVALTAGVAALWLAHYGRDAVNAEAARRGITVQRLFAAALQATARRPGIWDEDDFGRGIVNARQLIELPLAAIPAARVEAAGRRKADDARGLLTELRGPAPAPAGFDWPKYGLEVAEILCADALHGGVPGGSHPEARSLTRISPQLRGAAAASGDPRLAELATRPAGHTVTLRAVQPADMLKSLTILSKRAASPLESAVGLTRPRKLTRKEIQQRLTAAERMFARRERETTDPEATALRRHVLNAGEEVLRGLGDPARRGRPSGAERVVLEALVALHDRPALPVRDGKIVIEPDTPEIAQWQDAVTLGKDQIEPLLRSIGRIDADGTHIGTGFVVAPGLIMTNRHVVEEFAAPIPRRRNPKQWVMQSENLAIDFSEQPDQAAAPFKIKRVVFTGPAPILDKVRFTNLDLALLEVETTNSAGKALPVPVTLASQPARVSGKGMLYVVGYPAMPQVPFTDFDGVKRVEIVDQLRKIFGVRYGRKYFSPGFVHGSLGSHSDDTDRWVFDHDATTLGGNSGSCVIWFGDPMNVIGLHFAGDWMRANHAHALSAVGQALDAVPEFRMAAWT